MILCAVVAVAIVFLLPRFGVPIAGATLLFPLLMFGCCLLPMVFMMRSSKGKDGGSCCSTKEPKSGEDNKGETEKAKGSSGSCH